MPFINPGHAWLVLLLLLGVLIVKGPGKLPEMGAGLGRAIREFNRSRSDVQQSLLTSLTPATEPVPVAETAVPATAEASDSLRTPA
jgi:sec-independent protein translocase protein TatA